MEVGAAAEVVARCLGGRLGFALLWAPLIFRFLDRASCGSGDGGLVVDACAVLRVFDKFSHVLPVRPCADYRIDQWEKFGVESFGLIWSRETREQTSNLGHVDLSDEPGAPVPLLGVCDTAVFSFVEPRQRVKFDKQTIEYVQHGLFYWSGARFFIVRDQTTRTVVLCIFIVDAVFSR